MGNADAKACRTWFSRGDTLPEGRRCHFIRLLATEKSWERLSELAVTEGGSRDHPWRQALCTIGTAARRTPQILRQYSSMALSEENVPMRAALRMDVLAQAS